MAWLPDSTADQHYPAAYVSHQARAAVAIAPGARPVVVLPAAARLTAAPATDAASSARAEADGHTPTPTLYGAAGDGVHPAADQAAFQRLAAAIAASRSPAPTGKWDYAEYQSGAVIEPGIYDVGGLTQNAGSVRLVARIPGTVIIRIPAGLFGVSAFGTDLGLQITEGLGLVAVT